MSFSRIPLLFALLHTILPSNTFAGQPEAPSPISAPLRELPWGQLNFLHTTDTHGWHAGHLQEAQYAADWGDYISFAQHLHDRADADGTDLLLIDTGDRVEGNGLYDASDPKGKYTFDVLKQQRMNIITPGNHELYLANTSNREYHEVVPDFKDSYIASNLDWYNEKSGNFEPLAPRFRKFTTKNQGIRVLAFGFLFNFHGNANNTFVQPVEKTVKEQWFQDAVRTRDVDLIIVAGHVPVRDSQEYNLIYKAIRDARWDTPIAFFGGHTHIRDYVKYEKKAHGIESGRYMETLGFLSVSGLSSGKKDVLVPEASPTYRRLYIDNNLFSLHQHSGKNASTFDTDVGRNVSNIIAEVRGLLKLNHAFGCAPRDYWLNRAPYPSDDSLLTLLDKEIIPDVFKHVEKPSIVILNSGALRFDIFKGPFTIDTTYLVSPFTSGFRMLRDVPSGPAGQVLRLLNNQGPISLSDLLALSTSEETIGDWKLAELSPPLPPVSPQTLRASRKTNAQTGSQQHPLLSPTKNKDHPLAPGYTTVDDAGSDGDDTVHQTIQFYDVPNCIAADVGFPLAGADQPEKVDLIFNEFIQDWVLLALRFLGDAYEKDETEQTLDGRSMTDVISGWVGERWGCED